MEAKEGSHSDTEKKHTQETKETNSSETPEHPENKVSPTAEQPDPTSTEDPNPSVKAKKGTNYSREEIKKLLNLIQETLPVTEGDWEALTTKFNENCSFNRTSGSLKYNHLIKNNYSLFYMSFFSLSLFPCMFVFIFYFLFLFYFLFSLSLSL